MNLQEILLIVAAALLVSWVFFGYRAQHDAYGGRGYFFKEVLPMVVLIPPYLFILGLTRPKGFVQFFILQKSYYKTDLYL